MSEERKKILEMVESGRISPQEGAALLKAVSAPDEAETTQPPPGPPPPPSGTSPRVLRGEGAPTDRERMRAYHYWMYPLWGGLALLLIGGAFVTTMYQQHRVNAWTWLCGWIPLFVGLSIVTVAAWARNAHWIHVRVREHGKRMHFSLPLPLGLTAAAIRIARPFVPQLRDTGVDEAILALRDGLRGDEDITIKVQDDEEGESVEIDFGGEQ